MFFEFISSQFNEFRDCCGHLFSYGIQGFESSSTTCTGLTPSLHCDSIIMGRGGESSWTPSFTFRNMIILFSDSLRYLHRTY